MSKANIVDLISRRCRRWCSIFNVHAIWNHFHSSVWILLWPVSYTFHFIVKEWIWKIMMNYYERSRWNAQRYKTIDMKMKNERICVVNPRSKRLRLNSFNAINFNKADRFRFILLHISHILISYLWWHEFHEIKRKLTWVWNELKIVWLNKLKRECYRPDIAIKTVNQVRQSYTWKQRLPFAFHSIPIQMNLNPFWFSSFNVPTIVRMQQSASFSFIPIVLLLLCTIIFYKDQISPS